MTNKDYELMWMDLWQMLREDVGSTISYLNEHEKDGDPEEIKIFNVQKDYGKIIMTWMWELENNENTY